MSLAHAPDMDVLRLKIWAKDIRFTMARGAEVNDAFDEMLSKYPLTWSVLSLYIAQINSMMAHRLSDYPELHEAFPDDLKGMSVKVAISVVADRARPDEPCSDADWAAIGALWKFLPKLEIEGQVF